MSVLRDHWTESLREPLTIGVGVSLMLHALILALAGCRVPVLVAVRGQCLGGGLEIALAGGPIEIFREVADGALHREGCQTPQGAERTIQHRVAKVGQQLHILLPVKRAQHRP